MQCSYNICINLFLCVGPRYTVLQYSRCGEQDVYTIRLRQTHSKNTNLFNDLLAYIYLQIINYQNESRVINKTE